MHANAEKHLITPLGRDAEGEDAVLFYWRYLVFLYDG